MGIKDDTQAEEDVSFYTFFVRNPGFFYDSTGREGATCKKLFFKAV